MSQATNAKKFFNRMWWFVVIGFALMVGGLVVAAINPKAGLASNLIVLAGTVVTASGFALIVWYEHRHRNDPIDRSTQHDD